MTIMELPVSLWLRRRERCTRIARRKTRVNALMTLASIKFVGARS
jgi:hypothetical protein